MSDDRFTERFDPAAWREDRKPAAYLRRSLAGVGIVLDEAEEVAAVPRPAAQTVEVDRDEIRSVLVAAGANEAELAWLVPSCPSVAAARTWRPRRIA